MKLASLWLFACCVGYGQATAQSLSFEVASIKPSQSPDDDTGCFGGPGSSTPGQYACSNTTLADIVRSAFGVRFFQVFSAPQTRVFDITAKVPVGTTTKEQCRVMLQNLLIERFKLAYHHEKKNIEGYELVVGRNGPKLKESPPESAESATASSSGLPGRLTLDRDGFPVLPSRRGQMFISSLSNGAKRLIYEDVALQPVVDYVIMLLRCPVVDRTGLKGKYNVTLTFMDPRAGSRTGFAASTEDRPLPTANIDAAPSIFTAFEQQLGLKLNRKKVALDVVVIEHAEKTPTEN